MDFIDYYHVLELAKNASESDIKKAYRKMARKYHPDLNPKDEAAKKKFQQINEANEVLSDPEKRKKYDQYGKDWKHADEMKQRPQQQSSRTPYSGGDFGSYSEHDFSDFFESMFSGAGGEKRRPQSKYRGQDLTATLQINLKDIYRAQKQTLTINGKNIRLTIPAGVENGQTIKIADHGGEGMNNGPKGDLYITFSITNDSQFKRDGSNLYSDEDMDLYTAVLGGEITVDTFEGKAKLVVKPGTQNGTKVKLKGKGFPVYKKEGEFGDLIVSYRINIPSDLTEKEKELFTELSKLRSHGK